MNDLFKLGIVVLLGLSACSPANKVGEMPASDDHRGKSVDQEFDGETIEARLDILFVIDNSNSMDNHQAMLAANISRFVENFLDEKFVDFHIGVISTDTDRGTKCCGKLIGTPSFVHRNSPNLKADLERRMVIGVGGYGYEKMFDPIHLAFTTELNRTNVGFLRDNAHLAIIFVTDAEDQSTEHSAESLQQFLVALKGHESRVLTYGAIVRTSDVSCDREEQTAPYDLERFLSLSVNAGDNVFSLCDPLYGDKLSAVGRDLIRRVGRSFPLPYEPIVETIKLTFGTQKIPKDKLVGWSYDTQFKSIYLGPNIEWTRQPPGTRMRIEFQRAK